MVERLCSKVSIKTSCAFLLIMGLVSISSGQVPNWYEKLQQMKVAKSTREDLEKLFDNPTVTQTRIGKWNKIINYELKIGKLEVSYSNGRCSAESNPNGYDLEKNTVIRVSLLLFKMIEFSKLKISLDNFQEYEATDTNAVTYTDDENGIKYIGSKDKVRSIYYTIGDNLDNLDCTKIIKSARQ